MLHDSNNDTRFTPGLAHRQGATDRFYHTDWIGSTRYLTDGATGLEQSGLRFEAPVRDGFSDSPSSHPSDVLSPAPL